MMRYFKLWWSFFKMSFMADFEYRLNVTVRVFGEFAWYGAQLSVFEVLYTHASTISGWDIHAMRVFMGTLFLVDSIYMILFHESMDGVSGLVKKGDLDLYLTKPIDSQFMVSCRKVAVPYIANFFLVLGYLSWAIANLASEPSFYQLSSFAVLVVCGSIIYYSLRFLFSTLAIFLQDAGNIQFIWYQFFRLGTRPDPIYPQMMRMMVLIFFPVAFIASVPARVIVEGLDPLLLASSIGLAGSLLCLSHFFWNKALRHYASASS